MKEAYRQRGIGVIIIALCMAVAMILSTVGPVGVYHIQRKLIRREVKKQLLEVLADEELARFSVKRLLAEDVQWIHKGEFVLGRMYYDVVKYVETDSGRIVYCWPDHKEAELERLRSEVALNLLNEQRNENPSEFISYLVYLKGFYHCDDGPLRLLWSSIETEYFYKCLFSEGSYFSFFHPPEEV